MNGNSKHKPLSSEELFRMLEAKDAHASSGEELDDFEKDALEGFSAHVSAEQARNLTEEVHGLIHEKVQEQKTTRPASKLIWLSAAASVILIIIISGYFLTQSTTHISPNLALNKEAENAETQIQLPAADTKEISALEEQPQLAPQLAPGLKARDLTAEPAGAIAEQEATTYEKSAVSRSTQVVEDANRKDDQIAASKVAEQHSNGSYDKAMAEKSSDTDLKTASPEDQLVLADYARVEKKDQVAGLPEYKKMQKEESAPTYVAEPMHGVVMQKQQTKSKAPVTGSEKGTVVSETAVAKLEESKPSGPANRKASFPGGDPAIKAYVLGWMKKEGFDARGLTGIYHVKMKVLAGRTIVVTEIKSEKNVDPAMTDVLKKALNSMENWSPAFKSGKEVDSEIDLNLGF